MTSRKTRAERLHAAGFVPVPRGWVKPAFAERVQAQIDAYAAELEAVTATPRPVGRKPKETKNG